MKKFITYLLAPERLPDEGEFIAVSFWVRNAFDVDEFFLDKGKGPKLTKNFIMADKYRIGLIALTRQIEFEEGRSLLCTSRGEIIYANQKRPDSDWDYVMKIELGSVKK